MDKSMQEFIKAMAEQQAKQNAEQAKLIAELQQQADKRNAEQQQQADKRNAELQQQADKRNVELQQQADKRIEAILQLMQRLEQARVPQQARQDEATVRVSSIYKDLSNRMTTFDYCPEDNVTFDRWYARYRSIFETDAETLTAAQKVSLLTEKLSNADFQRFADRIAPQTKETVTFENAVTELTAMFGRKESLFSLRYKCLHIKKESGESLDDYTNRVNVKCEKFDVTHCSADDLKVLMFVTGLDKPEDSHILERLLVKVEEVEMARAAAVNPETHPKLRLKDICTIVKSFSNVKTEKAMIQQPESIIKSEILCTQRTRFQKSKPARSNSHDELSVPPNPCSFCGGLHWHSDCPYKENVCSSCKVKGHKTGYCQTALRFLSRFQSRKTSPDRRSERRQSLAIKAASCYTRKFVEPAIGNTTLQLQLDSGSDWTIITEPNWKKIGSPKLYKCKGQAISASQDEIPMLGRFTERLRLNGREGVGHIYVTKADVNVLGNEWMEALDLWNIPIASICSSRYKATTQLRQAAKRNHNSAPLRPLIQNSRTKRGSQKGE